MPQERKPPFISFAVYGEPATQGSKVPQLIRRKGGQIVLDKHGNPLSRVRDDNPKTAEWKQQVAHAARQVYSGPLITGDISVLFAFYRPRPKAHFGTGRNAGVLKTSAPPFPGSKPDTLKLARAVEDALTGVVWRDDSQIVRHELSKDWGECFRIEVAIWLL